MALTGAGVGSLTFTNTPGGPPGVNITIGVTGSAGRLIIIWCTESNITGFPRTVNTISGLGATWTFRAISNTNDVHGQNVEIWYADFNASTSGTVNITATGLVDAGVVLAVFVSSTTSSPITWDANSGGSGPAVPVALSGIGGGTATAPASTTSTAPYVLLVSGGASPGCGSPTPVSTLLESANASHTRTQFGNAYGGTPGQLSNTTSGFQTIPNDAWSCIIDALAEGFTTQNVMVV